MTRGFVLAVVFGFSSGVDVFVTCIAGALLCDLGLLVCGPFG